MIRTDFEISLFSETSTNRYMPYSNLNASSNFLSDPLCLLLFNFDNDNWRKIITSDLWRWYGQLMEIKFMVNEIILEVYDPII